LKQLPEQALAITEKYCDLECEDPLHWQSGGSWDHIGCVGDGAFRITTDEEPASSRCCLVARLLLKMGPGLGNFLESIE
jgi:hypothetical protein